MAESQKMALPILPKHLTVPAVYAAYSFDIFLSGLIHLVIRVA